MAFNKLYKILKSIVGANASFNSDIFDIQDMAGYAIQAKWSNQVGLAGSIKLQASNDGSNWEDVASSSQTFAGNGQFLWNVTTAFYRYVRVVATITGGSANFEINGNSKGY